MAAGKVKVIDLAKELGVTSKDLMVAAEEMGHKGVRAMTPLDSTLANALRVKLGKGRDLPEEPKPKRLSRPRGAKTVEGVDGSPGLDGAPAKVPRLERGGAGQSHRGTAGRNQTGGHHRQAETACPRAGGRAVDSQRSPRSRQSPLSSSR